MTTKSADPMQELADQAQELDMGYGRPQTALTKRHGPITGWGDKSQTADVPYAALLDIADEIITTVLRSGRDFAHDRKLAADILQRALKSPAFLSAKS